MVASFSLGALILVQLVPLLSLPPVLWRRGAPYVPTFQSQMETMFRLLRQEVRVNAWSCFECNIHEC